MFSNILDLLGQYKNTPNAGQQVSNNPSTDSLFGGGAQTDILAYVLDSLGKKIAPNNAFAGIGSQLAQNNAFQRAQKPIEDKNKLIEKIMLGTLMGDTRLTPAGMQGITSMSLAPGKDGSLPEYNLKGNFGNVGFYKQNLPFAGSSPSQTQPMGNSGLYQADEGLSWKENMERMGSQSDIRDLLTQVLAPVPNDPASVILSPEQQKMLANAKGEQKQELARTIQTAASMEDRRQEQGRQQALMQMRQREAEAKALQEQRKEARAVERHRLDVTAKRLGIGEKQFDASMRGVKAALTMQQLENAKKSGMNTDAMRQIHEEQLRTLRDPEVKEAMKNKKLADAAFAELRISKVTEAAKQKAEQAVKKDDKKHYEMQATLMEKWDPKGFMKKPFDAHMANKYGAYNVIFRGDNLGTEKASAVPQNFTMKDPNLSFIDSADKLYAYIAQTKKKENLSMKEFQQGVEALQKQGKLATSDYEEGFSFTDYVPFYETFAGKESEKDYADSGWDSLDFSPDDEDDEDDEDDDEEVEIRSSWED